MTALLDLAGPAVWRASWQAAALAVVVALLSLCFRERLAPQWRFLLWGVVVTRLLVVVTPDSPWSAFNLVRWEAATAVRPAASGEPPMSPAPTRIASVTAAGDRARRETPRVIESETAPPRAAARLDVPPASHRPSPESTPAVEARWQAPSVTRVLSSIWLAGCLAFALKLLATATMLRRRLSVCRPITDAAALDLLEETRRRLGLRRTPALLVTPACLSPCVVGTWSPRVVLSESLVTQASPERLRHVLAHELAHLVRGDLWTNWLLLAARVLHWFNPVAWWTVRAMQTEREAACDELAFAALHEEDRTAYAATIVELAAGLAPSPLAPGLIGLFSSAGRLKARVERLVRSPSTRTVRAPVAAALLLGTALVGLTDAMPRAEAQPPKGAAPAGGEGKEGPKAAAAARTHTVSGRCEDGADGSPLAGVTVRLYRAEGRTAPPVEIAKTVTDADGRYAFEGLAPPRPEGRLDRLVYGVFGFREGRPVGIAFMSFLREKEVVTLRIPRERGTLSGRVVDAQKRPVAGATVAPYFVYDRPIPALLSATTDADGRFKFEDLGVSKWPNGSVVPTSFVVLHPDHPGTSGKAEALPADVTVTLPTGCVVAGTATDAVTGKPAAGAEVIARRTDEWGESVAAADADGRYRLVVPEGRYDVSAEAKDRVCVALTDRECLAGETVMLPALRLIAGGFIAGRVIDTATGNPVSVSEGGEPIAIGLFGPSQLSGRVVAPARLATTDETGRFVLRAAPGLNYPYLVNARGDRMSWDTLKQTPVLVEEGETTPYDMLITPPVSPEQKLEAAREVVAALPRPPAERTARILGEFRKLSHTVDEAELWCSLMRELVAVGRDAVPQISAELDKTDDDRTLRRLAFALRAIGDPRAVPALIRALTKCLLPSSSDYGLIVADKELTEFMQAHDLNKGKGGAYFDLGRPPREVVAALHALTGQDFGDAELFDMMLSEDPRRQVLQRRLYRRQAERWQAWWETNWRTFTEDAAYRTVGLKPGDEPFPPALPALEKLARLGDGMSGAVLSPATEEGRHVWYAYDLDTGYRPNWPADLVKDEAARDPKRLEEWASRTGVDLICVTHRAADGSATYVLRALGMKVREISPRDLRNLDRLLAAGTPPEGRPVDGLLMHYDAESRRLVPDANAAFLFTTREGNMGVIEVTDRVTRTADLTGSAGSPPTGVGFHKGVRFDLKSIIP